MAELPNTGQLGKCPACRVEGVKLSDVNGLLICEKCSSKRFSNKVRKAIQEAFERQQEQYRREAWKKRMEIARKGVRLYQEGKVHDALRNFRDYISILEERYGVEKGGLYPALFDPKKKEDAGEVLLISGIYWDMTKIYDHMKDHSGEMRACLNKFLEFSIDRPHVILASEAIRKYIASGTAKHEQELKNARNLLHTHLARCFIATAVFGPQSREVEILRIFRDETLARTLVGRLFIRIYYIVSPPVAMTLVRIRPASRIVAIVLKPLTLLVDNLYNR